MTLRILTYPHEPISTRLLIGVTFNILVQKTMAVDEESLPAFGDLQISENLQGWGPSEIPDGFKDMPFQPFSKDTRLGKVADWCGTIYPDSKLKNRYTVQYGGGAQYAYYHDEDDSNFQLATSGKDSRSGSFRPRYRLPFRMRRGGQFGPGWGPGGGRGGPVGGQYMSLGNFGGRQRRYPMNDRDRMAMQNQQRRGGQGWQANRRGGWSGGPGGNWRQNPNDYNRRMNRQPKTASVQVKEDWTLLDELEFSRLAALSLPSVKEPENIMECGAVKFYDKTYDAVTTRNEKPLVRFSGVVHAVTTTEDPVIQKLARESKGNVFCTDKMAQAIMCAHKSIDSWDLIAIRIADKLFFDVRPDSNFDLVTVAETAADPPNEEPGHINCPEKLALEATFINLNFPQQVLNSVSLVSKMSHKNRLNNPFIDADDKEEAEKVASVGYRYRKFDLGGNIQCVIRCEVDAALPETAGQEPKKKNEKIPPPRFACIKALNEFDHRYCSGVNWRTKLDTQRGAVIASELKNNSCKMYKWTVGAIISGADQLKLGFVSRVNPKDTSHHVILGVQDFRPGDFAQQINLNIDNSWGILRCIIDYFMKCEPGQYLMMKDPNKPTLQIYSLPANAFASDESDDSSDEEPVKKN
ncbi:unnamed protein product [Schistocephalus solidus]|uniref:Eukaryotic translation initiation factor 3 subunit D n=1 Tax=Schistocephalus solidus TaxID=70667 RepID=A0A3P7EV93_SCHSO|nr:unnamed protein product [Schistocephalus solidus]